MQGLLADATARLEVVDDGAGGPPRVAVTINNTTIDDATAIELPHQSTERKVFEAFYIGLNGQVNEHSNLLSAYLTPAYSSSKSASLVVWETFLEAVRALRDSDRVKVVNMDGGPLNKAVETAVHFPQLMVDTGFYDAYLT